jgi:uncharacterized cupin superfamily protein
MGYHRLDPEEIGPTPDFPCERRSVSEAADLASLAAALYTVEPGERLARTYHYHEQREELFYVLAGTLSVRTPDRTVEVARDEVFVAEPDSPLLPHVPESAAESARVLGVGAPAADPGVPSEATGDSGSDRPD